MRKFTILSLTIVVVGCSRLPVFYYNEMDFSTIVPLIRVIAFPDAYNGKRIFVSGFLNIQHEGNALYFDKEHYLQGLTKNAIWIAYPSELADDIAKYHHRYVTVFGMFRVYPGGQAGFRGLYSGEIYIESTNDIWSLQTRDSPETSAELQCRCCIEADSE
jgi:hypothetical protein